MPKISVNRVSVHRRSPAIVVKSMSMNVRVLLVDTVVCVSMVSENLFAHVQKVSDVHSPHQSDEQHPDVLHSHRDKRTFV